MKEPTMRALLATATVACLLAGCAGPETSYQTRLRYQCATPDHAACAAARLVADDTPRRAREPLDLSGVPGVLLDIAVATPWP